MEYEVYIMCGFSIPEPLQPMRGSFNHIIKPKRVVKL